MTSDTERHPMTDDMLAEAERLCEAATPAPWYSILIADTYILCDGPRYDSARLDGGDSEPEDDDWPRGVGTPQGRKNMDLCVRSRTLLPQLVAECRRLQQELADIPPTILEVRAEAYDDVLRILRYDPWASVASIIERVERRRAEPGDGKETGT